MKKFISDMHKSLDRLEGLEQGVFRFILGTIYFEDDKFNRYDCTHIDVLHMCSGNYSYVKVPQIEVYEHFLLADDKCFPGALPIQVLKQMEEVSDNIVEHCTQTNASLFIVSV